MPCVEALNNPMLSWIALVKLRAEFLTLVLLSLMVLHQYEGTDLENAMAEVFSRVEGSGDLSPQVSMGSTSKWSSGFDL